MKPVTIRYLSGHDVAELALDNDEILDAIEHGLRAQGNGETVIEPRMHLRPEPSVDGHFNVLRGYIAPGNQAGVKIVGDFHDNYRQGCRPNSVCSTCSTAVPGSRVRCSTRPVLPRCVPAR